MGGVVATIAAESLRHAAGGSAIVTGTATVENPRMWGPPPTQRPHRYVAVTSVKRDGVELMFQSRASLSENVPALSGAPIGASQTFYIEVTGIQDLYERLRDRVEIVVDFHDTFYGTQEFYFLDINGYILSFSESSQQG